MERLSEWIDLRAAQVGVFLGLAGLALGLLAHRYATFPGDTWLATRIRSLGDPFEPVAFVFNEGDVLIAIAVVLALSVALVARHQANAALVVLVTASLRPLLTLGKRLVDRPRPSGDFEVLDIVYDSSFPSGHTMTAMLVFGLVFVFAPEVVSHRWVWPLRTLAAVAVGLMAVSRIWAGVHWPSDTYGALVWSGALIALGLALRPAAVRVTARHKRPR